jgi:hypothetical protein
LWVISWFWWLFLLLYTSFLIWCSSVFNSCIFLGNWSHIQKIIACAYIFKCFPLILL